MNMQDELKATNTNTPPPQNAVNKSMNIQDELKVQLELYRYLREEILESIRLQHRTFISESFFISIVFSLGLTQSNYKSLILSIVPAVVALTSLWLIEQSRMMRAGNYLYLLEDKINNSIKWPQMTWENWLRFRGEVSFWDVHKIHHRSQYTIMFLFILLGFFSTWSMWTLKILDETPLLILIIFYIILLLWLTFTVINVVVHRGRRVTRIEFSDWESSYREEIKKLAEKWGNN